jgi:membrane-bound lytic murein transglycosylase D
MKIRQSGSRKLIIFLALASGVGCQSAKKPSSSLSTFQAATPPIKAAQASDPAKSQGTQKSQSQTKTNATSPAIVSHPDAQKPATQPAANATEAKADPVAEVIQKAEKEYQAGETEYAAGHKEDAKQHFDKAFDILLSSPAEVRADSRFETEYSRVMDGSSKLELLEVQRAYNATEEKSEPAPIDEANEVTNYPVDPNLKAKAAAEIKATHSDLPLMMTDQVAGYINYFSTRGRGTLGHGLERSGRYREMIERILKEEGVPQDLIYLAQAESGFHPYAVSRVGARGIWQFMGSRARGYDLHRDFFMDERQDPEKSTRAAARHLKDLYNQFGDWYLAMAAYNSGPGTVQSAVKRTGYADFWELYRRNVLPKETRNYVPIIIAETIMAKNPAQYGLDSITPDQPMVYETVKINYPVDLRLVADCVDATPEQLEELNPSLLRRVTPKTHFDLHLPVGTSDKYQSAIASVPPDMRVWWRYHEVAQGDTLMSLGRKYHTLARTIADANSLDLHDTLEPGAKLVVPIAPGKHSSADLQTYAKRLTVYHVRKSDTVETVADNLGIPPTTIRRWNRLKGDSLAGRRVLYVHLPVSPASVPDRESASKSKRTSHLQSAKSGAPVHHTVKPGETLYSIATNYNTSVEAIKQNNAHVATMKPGMVLVIPQ